MNEQSSKDKCSQPTIIEIFDKMSYGPALEDASVAEDWLLKHDRKFGHFIDNSWAMPAERNVVKSINPCSGNVLASTIQGTSEDIELAVSKANTAYSSWASLSCTSRAKHLYSIARHVQKHSRLLAVIEALDNGKTVRETRDCDIPLVARHFYYYAGWAKLMNSHFPTCKSLGVVGAIVPWNFPLMLLSWKVAPALAIGNTVVLKPASNTRLSALLFAEICAEAGLPPGVFNVVTGNGKFGSELAMHPNVSKVAFTGSTDVGKHLRKVTAGTGKKLSLELGGKSPVIVFDSADLNSAVEGVVDAIWFNQGQVCSAGSRLLVQESVFDSFIMKLKRRMENLRSGSSLDKCMDMGAVVDEIQKNSIQEYVDLALKEGAEVFQSSSPPGCFFPPTLITGIGTVSKCFMEEIFGPVLVALPFRTAKEAVSLANNTMYGLGASVFTEKLTLAIETAKLIKAGAVWINCHNVFDAAAGFGGFKQSGYGRDGGKEGLYEYVQFKGQKQELRKALPVDLKTFGLPYRADGPDIVSSDSQMKVDQTLKLYYGGAQKRPDSGYCRVLRGQDSSILVGESNRKDIRNAVEAAQKAQPSWEKKTGFNRSQIIYYLAENLQLRAEEFTKHLIKMVGYSLDDAKKEVEASIDRLFHWAALADKFGGEVQETTIYGAVLRLHESTGVIGIACPDESPFLNFISLVGAAITRGNAVVVVPSEKYPTAALQFYQILETSDVPGGIINILTGNRDHLAKYLTEHHDVQAMWYFGSLEGSTFVESVSSCNLKKTWVNYGLQRNWFDEDEGQGFEFLLHATQIKNMWLTIGDIFAN